MFSEPTHFTGSSSYRLLPFRFRRSPSGNILLTNDVGEHIWLDNNTFSTFANKRLPLSDSAFWDLESRHFLSRDDEPIPYDALSIQYRTRKAFLFDGPALHIFVVTLRCNHSCKYCQVSRRVEDEQASSFDMTIEHANHAISHVLSAPAQAITVEFQGGEPLLAFPVIKHVIERLSRLAQESRKRFKFVITSVLHHLDDEKLDFLKQHEVELSTSLDGPAVLHNRNRPLPGRDSYKRTMAGVEAARRVLGQNAVAALTTITKESIEAPEQIIDTYREHGFHSIFLRPLSPYGFAAKSLRSDYTPVQFNAFYRRAVDYLIQLNIAGYPMDEAYAALLLRSIETPFAHGHVDLRSPAGAGFGVWAYNYNGKVYASDESRMLAEMGDDTFCLGQVTDSYETLLHSPAMELIAAGAVAESIPVCSDCAFLPYCGSDPIDSYRRQGDVIGHRPSSAFCERQMSILDYLFEKLRAGDAQTRAVLNSWTTRRAPKIEARAHGIASST